ncbi:SsrA-binding protein [Aquimarina rhabdastrellae]
MKHSFYKSLAKINKAILPSFTKKRLDLANASKIQLAIFAWRLYVTKRALGE